MPQLQDPNFHRSVVLMIEHTDEGALGIVLNHLTEFHCSDVSDSFDLEWPAGDSLMLRRGGPVEPQSLWMLHDDGWSFEETMRIAPGVAVSRSREALTRLCEADEDRVRLMIGYAGWGPGQLEQELAQGTWLTGELGAELIFEVEVEDAWSTAVRALGIEPAQLVEAGSTLQ